MRVRKAQLSGLANSEAEKKADAELHSAKLMLRFCLLEKRDAVPGEKWVISSVGRVPPLHGEGREFEPLITHHSLRNAVQYSEKFPSFSLDGESISET